MTKTLWAFKCAGLLFLALVFSASFCATAKAQDSRYVRNDPSKSVAIVFVHGVMGDSVGTWTNPSTNAYWPSLIAKDPAFNGSSIYVLQYPTPLAGRAHSVNELAEVMRRRLLAAGVLEHKELIFISHSMGGLVTRAFLVKYRDYAAQVRFAFFLATPTEGSPYATLASLASKNSQFRLMHPMQADNYLADLQRDWLAARLKIKSYCAYEGRATLGMLIVDQRSATNLCTEPLDPILETHIDIAKPASKDSDAYIAFKNAYLSPGPPKPSPGPDLRPRATKVDFGTGTELTYKQITVSKDMSPTLYVFDPECRVVVYISTVLPPGAKPLLVSLPIVGKPIYAERAKQFSHRFTVTDPIFKAATNWALDDANFSRMEKSGRDYFQNEARLGQQAIAAENFEAVIVMRAEELGKCEGSYYIDFSS